LISDQGLRTLVITGRPDFGAPDWRGNVPGRPMTDPEISDVVAWLSSQRPALASEIEAANIVPGGGR
jgi:cytochrome c oxidase cbb3-type subunit III